ncbi:MAG: UDP-N-acetylglucosamine diphosphorylase/glucosamine-1-phosphate N-acetyltransferase [Polaribacter sp.]|jgi:UDP-N-acetylglucosamine diphosphorylase/glucosamine-1-phosphate N-acetyltransferase
MNNVILFDNDRRDHLLPLTYTRPICELRIGILRIREKWEKLLNAQASFITQDYLSQKYPINIGEDNFVINGSVLPTAEMVRLISQLESNEALLHNESLVAARLNEKQFHRLMHEEEIEELAGFEIGETPFVQINNLWDIFSKNGDALKDDFELLTNGRQSQPLSDTNTVIGDPNLIFLEEGATVEASVLNTKNGPIYIGKNAEIMEGCMVRGGLALCEGAQLKLGAKVYGPTTIGPYSKIGGEVNNIVVTGYSSKGHDGYLGNAVLGEWCNLGAGTNSSNLKNNYTEVRVWDYPTESFAKTGSTFCGLIMGDHSKCGINTMFNTATVVGVSANVFGSGFPRAFIPSFAWGGASGFSTYKANKAFETAKIVMARRNKTFDEVEEQILNHIFEESSRFRRWENVTTDTTDTTDS